MPPVVRTSRLTDEIRLPGRPATHPLRVRLSRTNDIVLAGFGEGWKVDGRGTPRRHHQRPARACCSTICWSRLRSAQPAPKADQLLDRSHARRACTLQRIRDKVDQRSTTHTSEAQKHRATAGPANDHDHRRAGDEPFCPRAGGGRLSDEAAGDELRSGPDPGLPSYLQHDASRLARHAEHDAALVAGAQLRAAADRRRRAGLGNARAEREVPDRRDPFRRRTVERARPAK